MHTSASQVASQLMSTPPSLVKLTAGLALKVLFLVVFRHCACMHQWFDIIIGEMFSTPLIGNV
jgi:hypothetical protein